jgi:hypothetical protein
MDLINLSISEEYLDFMGNGCTAGVLLQEFRQLKTFEPSERYEIYAELYREYWATPVGYIFLSGLMEILGEPSDLIDLEIVLFTGYIQMSGIESQTCEKSLVSPHILPAELQKTIGFLRKGKQYADPLYATAELIEELIETLEAASN